MKKKMFILLLAAFVSVSSGYAQTINRDKLDSLFDAIAQNKKGMGSVAISKNGRLLYTKAIGYSDVKEQVPATEHTEYRIGSISKMFTATMIFQLVENGKLSLSTTLDKYYPSIPNAKKITISYMLSHRSGIHNFTNDSAYRVWMVQPKTEDGLVKIIADSNPEFEPNTKAEYSNSNFVLLGYILEKIYGKPYKELLKERITSKIGLAHTYYGGKTNTKKNESYSYTYSDGWQLSPETDMSIPGGAGAIVSTPSDLVKFIEALFAGKLISYKSLDEMKTMKDNFGMGMFQIPFGIKKAYGHNGGIDGFRSNLAYFPTDSLAVAYCTNGEVYDMNNILIGTLSIYYNMPYKIPTFTTVALKTEDLDKYMGTYSSPKFPLKIIITKDKTTVIAQATGQPSFPMDATAPDQFKFDRAGIELDFSPSKNEMNLHQGANNVLFTKE